MQQTNIMHFTEQLKNNRTMHNVLVSAECSDIQLHNIRLLPNIENPVLVGPYLMAVPNFQYLDSSVKSNTAYNVLVVAH